MRPVPMVNLVVMLLALAGCSNDAPTESPATEAPAADTSSSGDVVASSGDTQGVKKMMKRYNGQVKACYEDELEENTHLSGKVTVSFEIGTDGTVSEATSPENTTGNEALAACVLAIVRGITMTPPPGDVVEVAGYPFIFSTQ